MKYGRINGIDKPASRIGQGGVMISSKRPEQSLALLDGVFERGCTLFDTAHLYGHGDSERALGKWVASRGVREKVVIVTKGAHHSPGRRRVTPEDITSDLTESLDHLGSDTIDLYLLHRDDPDVPVGPIVECLHEHARAGRIRAFGGSNWSVARLAEANAYAESHGLRPFVASSPQFSLAVPARPVWGGCTSMSGSGGRDEREFYRREGFAVITWSSMALGFMSGRMTRQNIRSAGDYFSRTAVGVFATEENFRRLDRTKEIAARRGVSVPQIALAYILSQPLNIFPLVGCRSVEEFDANVGAIDIELTAPEIAYLELESDTL